MKTGQFFTLGKRDDAVFPYRFRSLLFDVEKHDVRAYTVNINKKIFDEM